MDILIKYKASGVVFGRNWSFTYNSYPAVRMEENSNYDELISIAKKKLENGSLDSGMGYETLLGALLTITTVRTIEFEGRLYSNEEVEFVFIGKLTDEQKLFLVETNEIWIDAEEIPTL